MRLPIASLCSLLFLCACGDTQTDTADDVIRGLKAYRITQTANTELRRYPSIVEPAKESKLSFEVAGQLLEVDLEVGQKVIEGEVLATLNSTSLELQEQEARARLEEADANVRNAQSDYDRKAKLKNDGFVTQAEFDQSSSTLSGSKALVQQAQKTIGHCNGKSQQGHPDFPL